MQFGAPSQPGTITLEFTHQSSSAQVSVNILGTDTPAQKAQKIADAIPAADPLLDVISVSGPTVTVSDSLVGLLNHINGIKVLTDSTFEQDAIILPFNPQEKYRAFRDFVPSSVVVPAGLDLALAVSDTKAFGVVTDGVKTADQIQSDISNAFVQLANIHWTAFSNPATGEQGLASDPIDESAAAQFMGVGVSSPDYTRYLGTIGVEIVPEPGAPPAAAILVAGAILLRGGRRTPHRA